MKKLSLLLVCVFAAVSLFAADTEEAALKSYRLDVVKGGLAPVAQKSPSAAKIVEPLLNTAADEYIIKFKAQVFDKFSDRAKKEWIEFQGSEACIKLNDKMVGATCRAAAGGDQKELITAFQDCEKEIMKHLPAASVEMNNAKLTIQKLQMELSLRLLELCETKTAEIQAAAAADIAAVKADKKVSGKSSCPKDGKCAGNDKISCPKDGKCSCNDKCSCPKDGKCSCNDKCSCPKDGKCSCNDKCSCPKDGKCAGADKCRGEVKK